MARLAALIIISLGLGLLLFRDHPYLTFLDLRSDTLNPPPPLLGCKNSTRQFEWETVSPSDELKWVQCYKTFSCTRLNVPLNYSEPSGSQAVIALIRQVSPLGSNSLDYRGPILFNPGGPGGSGVDLVAGTAAEMRVILGPSFDLVGFDPRGIAASTPRASFYGSEAERQIRNAAGVTSRVIGTTHEEIARSWANAQVTGKLAEDRNTNDYLRHINTENTARDMLFITEKYGFEKLQYMGYSYGTVLGSTFASLFPDKIERMIIDGVVDTDNYYAALWNNNLSDTDKTMQAFYDGCFAAGPQVCPFWFESPLQIQKELESLYEDVRKSPISVVSNTDYGIIDYARLRTSVFNALYAPWENFPVLAQALADLRNYRNGTKLLRLGSLEPFECSESCDPSRYTFSTVFEGMIAVACNDGLDVDPGLAPFLEYYNHLNNTYSFGDAWARIHMHCAGYPKWPKPHFQGPVGSAETSFPLLLIGNTADPVTPLWAAKKIGARFPGSAVLTQDSAGHCSLSGPSVCTAKVIRAYMVNGTLPKEGIVCNVDTSIFPSQPSEEDKQTHFSDVGTDAPLLAALVQLSKSTRSFHGPLMV